MRSKTIYKPSFFYIFISYQPQEEIPLDLLECVYKEHLETLSTQLNLRMHLVQIGSNLTKLVCSIDDFQGKTQQDELKKALIETSEKVFSIFLPQIKTPIVLQWELI